ncbi:hypothetical protein TraAM80_02236 [Trypanosoma rangeli]|uniref:Mon2 C-terminal domain-containing protein n=1 Tax=Trypanosoma rangeli TaxID=5698 RepID=A0A3R7MPW8_TRYRA|nr:uncharacterized protein TraAM80_02236 [Trypanosoma rangeli]RNF09362.1 hypothetical protein TraAM80_02236 [Trypanosoma rangeli]|eukprot:RNF09362.1 hypothetical protein TraAM80_02236 [Trypanosoma rangeli]
MRMSSQTGASATAAQTTNATLVATVFQHSLDDLLLTATRQRTMSPLRDAVQSARIKGFTAEDIFHTFVLACDMLHGRRQYRALLMQSLSDLGKIASLRMLPTSCSVVHIVCHLVQKLLGRALSGNVNLLQGGLRSTTVWERTGMDSLSNTLILERMAPPDAELREGSFSATLGSSEAAMDAQPPDEELQMRILQTLMAYLSACELGNAALSDIISIIFIMYMQAAPESLVEATCAATIEERTQALLRCLRSGGDAKQVEDDNAAFTAQIQAVAYAKDVCALCSGAAPKWLKLDLQRNSFTGPPDVSAVAAVTPPRRLRLLLLRTLITHFAEGERITSLHETSVFLTQLLNEDVVSVVLGRGMRLAPNAQRPLGETNLEHLEEMSLVDLVSFTDERPDAEEFSLMQQLGVVVLSKALPVMRHAMPILLRHHVVLVKLCTEEDTGEVGENAQHMAVVLTLWRKAIADHELLQQLLLLTVSSSVLLPTRLSTASLPGPTSSQRPNNNQQRAPLTRRQTRASEDDAAPMLLEPFPDRDDVTAESANGMYPFADLVTLTAELLSDIIIASEGMLNLDHLKATKDRGCPAAAAASVVEGENLRGALSIAFSRPLQLSSTVKMAKDRENGEGSSQLRVLANGTEERHPATGQAADVLSFLTMFTQSFARVVEASRLGDAMSAVHSRAAYADAQAAVTALFISLHSSLLRCFGLAAQHLQGDDVIHMILKGITHLVQTSCNLDLPAQRDSYLQIFVTRLCMPTSRPLLEGEAMRTHQRKHVAEESTSPAQPTGSPSLAGRGRKSPGKMTPKKHPSTAAAAAALHRSLEGLQDKFYVLNCVISVANSMGASLGEGWRPVASCLLLTEPLLKEVHRLLEQQQRQSQYDAVDDIALQDISRNADRVRDALHLLFIHTALLPDGVALDGLLKSFVTETCRRPASRYMLSLRMSSECCALALLTVAACRPDVSLALLRRLWSTVKELYMHVFDPVNLVEFVDACRHSDGAMETAAGVLERLVEDVAVMTAQLCLRVSSSVDEMKVEKREGQLQQRLRLGGEKGGVLGLRFAAGPYATAALVVRLTSLFPSPAQIQQNLSLTGFLTCHTSKAAEADTQTERRELLAAPTELLATIYGNLQQSQQRREEPQGNAAELATHVGEAVEPVTRGAALVVLKEVLKLVQGFGEELRGAAWEHLLRLIRHTAAPSGTRWNPAPTTAPLASVKQSIGIAFRALETIQHSCITSLDDEGLRQLIRCGGAFMTHHFPGFEHRLNINLSAVQLLWSIADYVVSRTMGDGRNDDLLWCTLLMQLYDGCLDVRPEVRQSALKTLFSLLQTYGGRLSAECWRCVLIAVLTPLMGIAVQAAATCATNADISTAPGVSCSRHSSAISQQARRRSSETDLTSLSEPAYVRYGGYTSEEDFCISRLLAHLEEQPARFEDMRVTIMDAVCRVFASHYQEMHVVLVLNCSETQRRTDGEMLLRETLSLFIELCRASRFVAQTTSGENAALSAVRALHVLMTASSNALLTENELEAAWIATEQLLHGGSDTAGTWPKQCTAAVVATIVASLGDVVAMRMTGRTQRLQQQQQQQQQQHGPTTAVGPTATVTMSPTFFEQLRHVFSSNSLDVSGGSRGQHDYFPHYLRIVQECLTSPAVTESYFFPGKVQTAVIGAWKMLWPALNAHERDAVINVALQQFPTRAAVMAFVTQRVNSKGKKGGSTTETRAVGVRPTESASLQEEKPCPRQLSLSESLPPGSHPSFLLALMDFFCTVADEVAREAVQQQDTHFNAAPAVVRAAGVLLLLEYASPALLAAPGPGVLFHAPPHFFDRAERCLTSFLGDILCGGASAPAPTPPPPPPPEAAMRPTMMHALSASLSAHRREGLLAFASVFSSLVSLADTQLGATGEREPQGVSTYNEAPEHLRGALQRLERFVLLLSEFLSTVVRQSGDMTSATELLAVLVPASSLEPPPLATIAKRSLDVLRRWSLSSSSSSSLSREVSFVKDQKQDCMPAAAPPSSRQEEEGDADKDAIRWPMPNASTASAAAVAASGAAFLEGEELSGQLKSLARASMGARNRAVLRRFRAHPTNEELRQMMKTALRTIILLYPSGLATQQPQPKRHLPGMLPASRDHHSVSADDTEEGRELLQGDLVELAHLVELTGEDEEFRCLLSRAMLGICASLGFSSST